MTRPPKSRRALRAALLTVPVLLAVAACGSATTPKTSHETFTAQTSTGLSYALETTVQGKKQCTSTTIRAALPSGKPGVETSSSCGAAGVVHPLLIQAKSSSQSILVDSPPKTCTTVQGGANHKSLRPLVTRCSTVGPLTRATVLPAVRQIVIVGVTKVPVINFPRHKCRVICVTALA